MVNKSAFDEGMYLSENPQGFILGKCIPSPVDASSFSLA
jgi:hypothetical protein